MFRPLPALLAAALLGLTATASRADVLILENKDRLTGTVVREENGIIVFRSEILGEISVPASKAHVETVMLIPVEAPPIPSLEKPAEKPAEIAAATKPPAPKAVAQKKPNASYKFKPLDLRTATRDPEQAEKAEQIPWIRRFELGLTSQTGRTEKSDVVLNFEAGRRGRRSEARITARYLYGETNDNATADLMEGSLRLRRNLSRTMFAQSSTRIARDKIKKLDLDGEQGIGLGRNLVNRDGLVLAMGAGTAARYREEVAQEGEWAYLVDGFQDLRYEINSHFSLTQDLSLVTAPAIDNDYKIRLNAAVTAKITDTINMSMRYEYEYDSTLAILLRDNQRIVTSLVYVF